MAGYWENFTGKTLGSAPSGFTVRWTTANSTWSVATGGDDRIATNALIGGATLTGLSMDSVDSDANRANVEVLVLIQTPDTSDGEKVGAFVRASGTSSKSGYYAELYRTGGVSNLRVSLILSNSVFVLSTTAYTWAGGEYHYIRFRANGSTLTARAWKKGTSEPGTWNISTSDGSLSIGGWQGIFNNSASALNCDFVSIGTNGDTAASTGPSFYHGQSALSETSTVTSNGIRRSHAQAALSESSTVTSNGTKRIHGVSALSEASTVTSNGTKRIHAQCAISEISIVVVNGVIVHYSHGQAAIDTGPTVVVSDGHGHPYQHGQASILSMSFVLADSQFDPLADFLADTEVQRNYVVKISPFDRGSQATVDRWYGTYGLTTEPDDTPSNTIIEGAIKENLVFSRSLWTSNQDGPHIGGHTLPDYGFIRFYNEEGLFREYKSFNVDGRSIQISVGGVDWYVEDYFDVFNGTVTRMEAAEKSATFYLQSIASQFDVPLQNKFYRGMAYGIDTGTTGANYITFGNVGDVTGDMCVEFWIQPNIITGEAAVISKSNGSDGWWFGYDANGLKARMFTSGAPVSTGATELATGLLHHVAINYYKLTGVFEFYVDGIYVHTLTQAPTTSQTNSSAMSIGALSNGAKPAYAKIDEVRVWNVARTADEILSDKDKQIGPTTPYLVFYSQLNEGAGTATTASTPASTAGTFNGTLTWWDTLTGSSDIGGNPLPIGYGPVENASPTLVNAKKFIYQFNDVPSQAITAVYDNGVLLTPVTDYTIDLTRSMFTLTSSPLDTSKITVSFQGPVFSIDPSGPSTGYDKPADIALDILWRRSGVVDNTITGDPITDFVDLDSVYQYDSDMSSSVSIYYSETANLLDVLDSLIDGSGGAWFVSRSGLIKFTLFADPNPYRVFDLRLPPVFPPPGAPPYYKAEFTDDPSMFQGYDRTIEPVVSIQPIAMAPPVWKITGSGVPNYTIQEGLVASTAISADRAAFVAEATRVRSKESAAVKRAHLLARNDEPFPTNFVTTTALRSEVSRRFDILSQDREMYRVVAKIKPLSLDLNDVILLWSDEYQLYGWPARILVMEEQLDSNQVTMDVWG